MLDERELSSAIADAMIEQAPPALRASRLVDAGRAGRKRSGWQLEMERHVGHCAPLKNEQFKARGLLHQTFALDCVPPNHQRYAYPDFTSFGNTRLVAYYT